MLPNPRRPPHSIFFHHFRYGTRGTVANRLANREPVTQAERLAAARAVREAEDEVTIWELAAATHDARIAQARRELELALAAQRPAPDVSPAPRSRRSPG